MKNKKGLSNVVATVLIVLIALAAVVMTWAFVRPTIEDAGTSINLQNKCLNIEVRPTACNATTGTVTVQLVRGSPDLVVGFLKNDAGMVNSASLDAPPALGTVTATPGVDGFGSGETLTGSASAIVIDPDDPANQVTCSVSPERICTGTVPES